MENTVRIRREEKEETFRISLRDFVAPLFRRKKVLLTVFSVLAGLTVLGAFVVPAPYKAHMSILVQRDRLNPLVSTEATTQVVNGTLQITEEETNSEMQLLKSHDVLEKVVMDCGLDKPRPAAWMQWISPKLQAMTQSQDSEADRRERAVRRLAKHLKVDSGANKSNVIDVSYKSSDPAEAFRVMRSLADHYVEKHMEVHSAYGSANFFDGQMQKYKTALDASEQKLRDFSHDQGVSAPDVMRSDLAQQVAEVTGLLHTARAQAAADAAHIRIDEEQLQLTPERATTLMQSQPADKLLGDLNSELVAAETKRTQLAMKYDAHYPLVKEADDEIAQIKQAIAKAEKTVYTTSTTDKDPTHELIRQDLAKTRADEAAARANVVALARAVTSLQGQMVSLDGKALQQHDLERDHKMNEDNYLLYQSKWEQAQASEALNRTRIANVSIADPPEVPALPAYSTLTFLLAGFAFSIALSVAAAYVADYLDSSFHTPRQVAEVLEVPVVIAIPKRA